MRLSTRAKARWSAAHSGKMAHVVIVLHPPFNPLDHKSGFDPREGSVPWRERLDPGGLLSHRNFRNFWIGATASQVGNEANRIIIPLIGALTLGATAGQMGMLSMLRAAPWFLIGLIAGAWVDRQRRIPLLVVSQAGMGMLLLSVPVAAHFELMGMEYLYVVVFAIGTLSVLANVATQSALPLLLPKEQLVDGNGKLSVSRSFASAIGPGLGGWVVQQTSSVIAMGSNGIIYLLAALSSSRVVCNEGNCGASQKDTHIIKDIVEGVKMVIGMPMLRAVTMSIATANLFAVAFTALEALYVTRSLGISAGMYGTAISLGSAGYLLGALIAAPAAARFGIGPTIAIGITVSGTGCLILPFARGDTLMLPVLVTISHAIAGLGVASAMVSASSLRQAITPDRLQGRGVATQNVLVMGAPLLGGALAGLLGESMGLRETLMITSIGQMLAALCVVFSPVVNVLQLPDVSAEKDSAEKATYTMAAEPGPAEETPTNRPDPGSLA
jgi:MFS family permease